MRVSASSSSGSSSTTSSVSALRIRNRCAPRSPLTVSSTIANSLRRNCGSSCMWRASRSDDEGQVVQRELAAEQVHLLLADQPAAVGLLAERVLAGAGEAAGGAQTVLPGVTRPELVDDQVAAHDRAAVDALIRQHLHVGDRAHGP